MNQGFSNQPGAGSTNPKVQSFLEALRNSRGKVAPGEMGSNPFAEFTNRKEVEKKRVESFYKARSEEWNRVYSAKEKQKEQRIEQIRRELKQEMARLAQRTKALESTLAQAIDRPVVAGGDYHINFFQHVKSVIQDMMLTVTSANTWLEQYNRRAKKQSYYWGMAAKKGNSFTINNERNAATSVG